LPVPDRIKHVCFRRDIPLKTNIPAGPTRDPAPATLSAVAAVQQNTEFPSERKNYTTIIHRVARFGPYHEFDCVQDVSVAPLQHVFDVHASLVREHTP